MKTPSQPAPARRGRSNRVSVALAPWLLCLLLLAPLAHASVASAPGGQLEVALLTYGPGAIYWERFGHDAIDIRDVASGESIAFNYGVFDFDQDHFLTNFIRGHMRYRIDAVYTANALAFYRREGRSIRRQVLNLEPSQRAALRDFLLWNLQPAHAHYRYRYYTANCATKVRDALDRALGGGLHAQLQSRPVPLTWRQQTDRLMAAQPALMLLIDLGLSGRADQPLNAWQASFLPATLARQLAAVQVHKADGSAPLVASDTMLSPSRLPAPPTQPPDLRLPLLLAGAVLAWLLWLTGRSDHKLARRTFAVLASVWLLAAGLAGSLMLLLWLATAHQIAWANANLLLLNPLAWGLIPAVWRYRSRRWEHMLVWLLLLAAAFALLANLTGLLGQRNLPWIVLVLPLWLALAHTLRTRLRGRPARR